MLIIEIVPRSWKESNCVVRLNSDVDYRLIRYNELDRLYGLKPDLIIGLEILSEDDIQRFICTLDDYQRKVVNIT